MSVSYTHLDVYKRQIVVCVDGRGTGGRGEAFEKCTYLKIGVTMLSRSKIHPIIQQHNGAENHC